jgi:methyl-accepting chemotaxis protein
VRRFAQTVKFKIIAAFAVCVALIAAIGVFGTFGLSRLDSNMTGSYTGNIVPMGDLSTARTALLKIVLQLRRIQVFRDPGKTAESTELIRTTFERLNEAWGRYYRPGSISSRKELEVAERIRNTLPQFTDLANQALAAAGAGDFEEASSIIEKLIPAATTLSLEFDQDVAINADQSKEFSDDSKSMASAILSISIALVSVSVAVAFGASIYLLRTISAPLNEAARIATQIASGKLDNHVGKDSSEEFGTLLDALKKMDQQLSETVVGIKTATESVSVASREIASGNADLSARTEAQAASLEETAASMTQLTETVKQNAENTRQAGTLATRATEIADIGNDSVQGMMRTIEKINSSSTRISEITGVIEGIAFQTNILALNAAVEAARAGEQGRGFAVVASEVRSLAQRSATAAKEIKELIGATVAIIQVGSAQASDVSSSMGRIKLAIKQVSDIVVEIAGASEEQSRGIEQVNQAVGQMDDVTQQNAALVEQAAAAAHSLEEQAVRLTEAVSVFKLRDPEQSLSFPSLPSSESGSRISATSVKPYSAPSKPEVPRVPILAKALANTGNSTGKADWEVF